MHPRPRRPSRFRCTPSATANRNRVEHAARLGSGAGSAVRPPRQRIETSWVRRFRALVSSAVRPPRQRIETHKATGKSGCLSRSAVRPPRQRIETMSGRPDWRGSDPFRCTPSATANRNAKPAAKPTTTGSAVRPPRQRIETTGLSLKPLMSTRSAVRPPRQRIETRRRFQFPNCCARSAVRPPRQRIETR